MTHPLTQPETWESQDQTWESKEDTWEERLRKLGREQGVIDESDFNRNLEALLAFIRQELETQAKAFGNCTLCYGKGYHTELSGISWSGDFEDTSGNKTLHNINPCTCDRGKQIEKLLTFTKDRERETLLFTVETDVIDCEVPFDESLDTPLEGQYKMRELQRAKLTALRKSK